MLTIDALDGFTLTPAAELFTSNYRKLRDSVPLLPPQFGVADEIKRKLIPLLEANPGVVAIEEGQVVGYLAGFGGIPHFKGNATGVYVPVWGHASVDNTNRASIYRALYRACSAEWVKQGWHTHAITYFQPDAVLADAFFGLGFGLVVIDAMRTMQSVADLPPCSYTIRMVTAVDRSAIAQMDAALGAHLRSAPTFLDIQPVAEDNLVPEFIADDRALFVAWDGDRAVAGIRGLLNRGDGCDLLDVDGTLGITFGYTVPDARRTHVATQVLNELLRWGREQGMTRCSVDFESANLHARGFWEHHFQPICHSAIRRVDERM